MKGRLTIAAGLTTAVALAAPAAASAATLGAAPQKSCYRAGEEIVLSGSGYTPDSGVSISSDGAPLGTDVADGAGNFDGDLRVGVPSGEKVKTYAATDQSNPANTASVQLRISALSVTLRPKHGQPNRRFRIRARGFTTGKVLYAHVVRGSFRRTVKVGRLKGDCHKVSARRRLFPRSLASGTYRVQFDSRRRYSKGTKVKIVRRFQVTRSLG